MDNEVKGEGNSYDFGARMLDSRIGRWFAPDPKEKNYPSMSTYNYTLNNPIFYIDPDGKEPIKGKVVGLKSFIRLVIAEDVNSISSLREHYNSKQTKATGDLEIGGKRYLYSERWGWLDVKHFAAAAEGTNRWYATGDMVLDRGESIERDQAKSKTSENGSAYAYEDLPSNLLGVYFEEWLENDESSDNELKKLGKELDLENDGDNVFALKLYKYMKELGFVDKPEKVEDYKNIPNGSKDTSELRGLKNTSYNPHPQTVTKGLSEKIDIEIINRSRKHKGLDPIKLEDSKEKPTEPAAIKNKTN